MSKTTILVATRTLDCNNVFGGYHTSVMNLDKVCKSKSINVLNAHVNNDSLPHKAKNAVCDVFMQSPYTHLLFIDADIEFNAEDIIKMVEFDKPVVGGLNHKKTILWDKIVTLANEKGDKNYSVEYLKMLSKDYNFIPKDDDMKNVDLTHDFIEVDAVGTGVLLIKKEALKKIQDAYTKDKYLDQDSSLFRYFDTALKMTSVINTNIYLGDDVFFCNRWKELGGKIYLYTKFQCRHWGMYAY